ncbi:SDR family NAD(P)-dependent oxidoreductase [Plantibacter sp. Mn2098]|uniref:SDR family NAD(P)-dependent oxidoreductase n=1 Tax=Plantibacter sp. Mn2098 TaxID=3395266 RepID=UPI003BBAB975
MTWNVDVLPDQRGRVIAVTGANAGLGFWTSYALAKAGAEVVLACRNEQKAAAAIRAIQGRVPDATLSFLPLDTSSIASSTAAGEELGAKQRLDALVENAGIVHFPKHREESVDGNELVFATNVVGHAAILPHALPALERTAGARVVLLGSLSTHLVKLRIDDLQLRTGYTGWQAYAQSKIGLSALGFELDRRLQASGSRVRALVAHPGFAISGLSPRVPGVNEPSRWNRFTDVLQSPFAQGKHRGAEPTVRAVADPDARGGAFYGPKYRTKGAPVIATPAAVTTDVAVGASVWEQLEAIIGRPILPTA